MKKYIFSAILILLAKNAAASAETIDLYSCSNEILNVEVSISGISDMKTAYYKVMLSYPNDEMQIFTASVILNKEISSPQSIFALSEEQDSHGTLGKGVLINFNGSKSMIALDGVVQRISCFKSR